MKYNINLIITAIIAFGIYPLVNGADETEYVNGLDKNGNPQGFKTLALGDKAPDFSLLGIDGKTYSLANFSESKILMVLFTSNHCPTSHAIEKRLQKLRDDFRDKSFALVAINPNHPDGLNIDELGYGEFNDSFEHMKPYAEKNGWDFPYIYDGETQQVARAYGCLATPHLFIFDEERKLRYAGRFDDSRYAPEETVKSPDARNALNDLFADRPVAVPLTRPHGCSTKWREKRAKHAVVEASRKEIPVTIETINSEGVAALRTNNGENYRFINVWATWCAPCVQEFPDLVSISHQYDMRNFEFISISLDQPGDVEKVKEFLQKNGAGVTPRKVKILKKEGRTTSHYIYSGASQDELATKLDNEWPGPVPHTILVAPGGKIVWRHNGVIDPAAARTAIVKELGAFFQPKK